jgi:hypothetical protein
MNADNQKIPVPFVPGQAYFLVLFEDKNLKIPVIQTLIFKERRAGKEGFEYFFREIGRESDDALYLVHERDRDELVVDKAGLIALLSDV